LLDQVAAVPEPSPDDLYEIAATIALLDQGDSAIDYLRRAIMAGFRDRNIILIHPPLNSIRDDEIFRELLAIKN
jgi:hypothetical protein